MADAEWLFPHDAHGSPIAERAHFSQEDALALFQTARHRIAVEGLRTKDARVGTADALHVLAYPSDEAPAADCAKNGVEVLGVRELLEDLHADGALAGDDERVVVRGHKGEAVRNGETGALGLGLVKVYAVEDDFGAEARDTAHFNGRRALRHHDRAWYPKSRTREGDALSVVA